MDKRIEKTQGLIKENFFKLIATKDIAKISVSEICRMSNISRGTFYLHYNDVYDICDKLEEELCNELVDLFEQAYPISDKDNERKFVGLLMRFLSEKRDVFIAFSRVGDGQHLYDKLRTIFSNKVLWDEPELYQSRYDEIESKFVVSGIIGIIQEWIFKQDMTIDDLVEYLSIILNKFANS